MFIIIPSCWIAVVYVLIKIICESLAKPAKYKPEPLPPPDAVIDVVRYEDDKLVWGEKTVEAWRKMGDYRCRRNNPEWVVEKAARIRQERKEGKEA